MRVKLPDEFVRTTRWSYTDRGIEIGPFSAEEILELLDKRKITPNTTLVELNSRRQCPVSAVGPFAQFVLELLGEDERRRSQEDFERTRESVARAARIKIMVFVAAGVVVLGGRGLLLWVYNPFRPKEPTHLVVSEGTAPGTTPAGARTPARR